jgi:uncharacterized protein
MEGKIKKYLAEIEKERNIQILLACETGSRAWGFPSPDSDYDVRIIYKHEKNWYLSLNEEKDSIELMLDNNEIDISGWDLRKSLKLLWKSNPPLLERIQSPIVYRVNENFLAEINVLARKMYSKIATMYHYLSMAKKGFEELENAKEFKLKKFFYALRASVACKWIIEKEEIPPIYFPKMLEGLTIDETLKQRIYQLIELKATISETYMHTGEKELIELIQNCINEAEIISKNQPSSSGSMTDLNAFFIHELSKDDH